jgi:hypothetical protein
LQQKLGSSQFKTDKIIVRVDIGLIKGLANEQTKGWGNFDILFLHHRVFSVCILADAL